MTKQQSNSQGIVFNIQKFTTHDGPGIRTEIFLKGCQLSCLWCSNPEGMRPNSEIAVTKSRCLGVLSCGYCLQDCPLAEAPFIVEDGLVSGLRRDVCSGCGNCAQRCYPQALRSWGKTMSVEEVMEEIRSDLAFYQRSGGGATFSGGDSTVQWPFLLELLKACRVSGIHTCVESALACRPAIIDAIFPYTDLFISDIKQMDSAKHLLYTGVGNERILQNLKKLISLKAQLILRIPVIPGYNDDEENMRASGDFILQELDNRIVQLQLLKFRKLGEEKYASLGIAYPMAKLVEPAKDDFERKIRDYAEYFRSRGIPAIAGTNTEPTA